MSKSNYLEAEILDHILGGADYPRPATVHVALLTDSNTAVQRDAGTVTEVSAAVWTNYARKAVTNNVTNFPAATGTAPTTKANGTIIDFGTATVTGTAPVVTAFAIYDAATSGNLLYHGALTTSMTINNTNPVSFPIGALTITED